MWIDFVFPDAENGFELPTRESVQDRPADFFERILHQEPLREVIQAVMPGRTRSGAARTSVCDTRIEATGPQSCRVTEEEVHNLWDLVTYLSAWLTDYHNDHFHDLFGELKGETTPALKALPQIAMLSFIARAFARAELAPPNSNSS